MRISANSTSEAMPKESLSLEGVIKNYTMVFSVSLSKK